MWNWRRRLSGSQRMSKHSSSTDISRTTASRDLTAAEDKGQSFVRLVRAADAPGAPPEAIIALRTYIENHPGFRGDSILSAEWLNRAFSSKSSARVCQRENLFGLN